MRGRALLAAMLALGAAVVPLTGAVAGCTRALTVPVSLSGASVYREGQELKGIYPDLMRELARKTGCQFNMPPVPRARQVAMFKAGQADVLTPASRTAERDRLGTFVPLISNRAMLVSMASSRAPIGSARELLARRELRVAVVRGFDFGEQYAALVKELSSQGRVFVEVDVTAVARLLLAGSVDLTIMGPTQMIGAIRRDPRLAALQDRLRIEAVPELAWKFSGAYVSNTLAPADRTTLLEALDKIARSNHMMESYGRYFQDEALQDSVRRR